jgi:hypothetical protein
MNGTCLPLLLLAAGRVYICSCNLTSIIQSTKSGNTSIPYGI